MTCALIHGNSVLKIWESVPPANYLLPNGVSLSTYPMPVPWEGPDRYALIPAQYTDALGDNQVQLPFDDATLAQWTVTDGIASGPRKWQTIELTRDIYNSMINRERDRRIALGATVEVSTGKFIPVDTRNSDDLRNIQGLATIAFSRIAASDNTPIAFRGSDNIIYSLTPQEMWKLANGEGVAGHVAYLYAKAWALKDVPEMTTHYALDSHWA